MHSRIVTTLITATALVLSGCASEPETTLEPDQKAFVFESGVVPIGDFDPSVIAKEDLFDPCNEISDEEFARAGFVGEKLSSTKGEIESPHGTSVCTFTDESFSKTFSVMNTDANREMAEQERVVHPEIRSSTLPELYAYHEEVGRKQRNPCIVQLDTSKGAIAVGFTTLHKGYSFDDTCLESIAKLENLYNLQFSTNTRGN